MESQKRDEAKKILEEMFIKTLSLSNLRNLPRTYDKLFTKDESIEKEMNDLCADIACLQCKLLDMIHE